MNFKLPQSPLHAASCFRDPAIESTENNKNMEAGPSTSPLPTASPANRMLGMLSPAWSPAWAQKAIREYASPENEHVPQWTPSPEWEEDSCLVPEERGKDLLKNLKLHKENIAEGHFGSVSIFENQNGEKIIGKFLKAEDDISQKELSENEFFREFDAFKKIYENEEAGRHRNLVNMYGIAKMNDKEGVPTRAILMDAIPGPTGTKLFDELRKRWGTGDITPSKYWGVIQFIGRRMFDVVEHMSKADVIHNDIKPDNFLVNEETGEPVLIDLGGWSVKDDPARCISDAYSPPEARIAYGVDERSDVFSAGATLLHGIEGGEIKRDEDMPSRGLRLATELRKDEDGNVVRQPRTYAAKTAITKFFMGEDFKGGVLQNNRDKRFTAEEAKNHDFLNHALLDDDDAKKEIIKVIKDAKNEEEKLAKENNKLLKSKQNSFNNRAKQSPKKIKPRLDKSLSFPEKQYYSAGIPENLTLIKHDFKSLRASPNLHMYASLQSFGRNDPEVKKYLEKNENKAPEVKQNIEKTIMLNALAYIAQADWFEHAKSVFEKEAPTLPVKIPVNDINSKYSNDVYKAKEKLSAYVDTQSLKHYVESADAFLYKARALKGIDSQEAKEKIEQVRERAALASRMLEIFELTSASASASASSKIHELLDHDIAEDAAQKGVSMSLDRMDAREKDALTSSSIVEKEKKKNLLGQMKSMYNKAYSSVKKDPK